MPQPDENQLILPHFNLKVNGAQAAQDVMMDLVEVTVENTQHLPDVCTLHIHDSQHPTENGEGFKHIDGDTFNIGKTIEVEAGFQNNLTSIFYGEVTALEIDMAAHGTPTMIVHCLDHSHRMHRGRQSRSFVQVKDSDLVSQLAGEAGLTAASVDSTSDVHDWVFQKNQTNWEFLTQRARRVGCRLFVDGQKQLHFKKVQNDTNATLSMEWGQDLISFRPFVKANQQVDQVTVRGWDRKTKAVIVGQTSEGAQGVPQVGTSTNGGSVASSAFGGSAKMVVLDRPVFSQSEAQTIAESVRDDIGGEFLEAEGLCQGHPEVKPGKMVEIKNIGTKYSGKYQITSTTHTYSPIEGYTTQFQISGKRPSESILSLINDESGGARSPMGSNIVIGIVTDNKDPEDGLGRVKVKYPTFTGDHGSDWAPIVSPMAGGGRGFYYLPEVNDEVLVAFEHGDIHRPYIIGALWNGVDNPPEKNSEAVDSSGVIHRIIKTRIGHTMLFDDKDGTGEIKLTTCNGHTLTLNDKDKKIEAKTTSGHTITMDDQNSNIVIVDKTGTQKMTIDSSANSIKMECAGNFDIDSKGKITIQGTQGIEMTTPAQFKTTAQAGLEMNTPAQMKLHADAQMSVTASGPTEIKGVVVQIN